MARKMSFMCPVGRPFRRLLSSQEIKYRTSAKLRKLPQRGSARKPKRLHKASVREQLPKEPKLQLSKPSLEFPTRPTAPLNTPPNLQTGSPAIPTPRITCSWALQLSPSEQR